MDGLPTSLFGMCFAALFTQSRETASLAPRALHRLFDPGLLPVPSAGCRSHRPGLAGACGVRERPQLVRRETEWRGEDDRDCLSGEMSGAGGDEDGEKELVRAERETRD